MSDPIHVHPTTELASRVLLPGDPGRALLLSQSLLDQPKMFNHNRGLWGYSGIAADGELLTIQSTGMGGPSAAIVASELITLGARQLVRVGTCGAIDPSLALGELLIVTCALACDGTSQALGAAGPVPASPDLLSSLTAAGGREARSGVVASSDLFYDNRPAPERDWAAAGAVALEMESATLLTLASNHGVHAAAILIVSDIILPSRRRIGRDALQEAEQRAGDVASRALARVKPMSSVHSAN